MSDAHLCVPNWSPPDAQSNSPQKRPSRSALAPIRPALPRSVFFPTGKRAYLFLQYAALGLLLINMEQPAATQYSRPVHVDEHAQGVSALQCRGKLLSWSRVGLSLRGGKDQHWVGGKGRNKGVASRGAAVQGSGSRFEEVGGGVDVKKRLQEKLRILGERRKILNNYESKYAAYTADNTEKDDKLKADKSCSQESAWNKHTKITHIKLDHSMSDDAPDDEHDERKLIDKKSRADVDSRETTKGKISDQKDDSQQVGKPKKSLVTPCASNSTTGGLSTAISSSGGSPDALLRELNRTGLCRKGELDARVETFIIKLKKEGKRAALASALMLFRAHLLRPQSHKRRVRNKSAVLTKLLLKALRQHDASCSPHTRSASTTAKEGVSASANRADEWASDLSYLEKMANLLFVGVLAKAPSHEETAETFKAWWGSPSMTGKVFYVVSNGRCLNGGSLVSTSDTKFGEGDIVLVNFSPADRCVSFYKRAAGVDKCSRDGDVVGNRSAVQATQETPDLLLGSVYNVSGRVRVGVQFKCKGDRVTLLARDSLESTAPHCLDRGTRELDSEELADHFKKQFGAVASVKTMHVSAFAFCCYEKFRDGGQAARGFAFVTFYDLRDANRALAKGRVHYKKGALFAKMQVKPCDGALKKESNEYDMYTAEVLKESDARSVEQKRQQKLQALTPEQLRLLESRAEKTKVVALDCEFVGVGPSSREHALARVSVVNSKGESLYSRFVVPSETVTDYRSRITGLSAGNLTAAAGAVPFDEARGVVAALLLRRVVVGHGLRNDFKVLQLDHPVSAIRDTAKYRPLRLSADDATPSLKLLAARVLNKDIQSGVHNPTEDARIALEIYLKCAEEWERSVERMKKSAAARIKARRRR